MAYDAVIPNFPSIANVTFNATKSELKKKSYQYETNFSEGSLIKKKKVFVYYVLHFLRIRFLSFL